MRALEELPDEAAVNDSLSEEQAERLLEFHLDAERQTRSSAALAIVTAIARETVLRGQCQISHKEFGRRIGTCRRSIHTAMKVLERRDLIERVGTTDSGVAIYRANLDEMSCGHEVD